MGNIVQFIESLGRLHDATITEMLWFPQEKRLELGIEDLYWNFEGLPEYPGAAAGRFIFSQVLKFFPAADFAERGLTINHLLLCEAEVAGYSGEILFNSGGRLLIECGHIECRQDKT